MTEKRFEKAKFGTVIKDNSKQDTLWTATECIDRMNELAEENTRLKKEIETGKEYCKLIEIGLAKCADNRILLQKENKQLQERNNRQAKQLGNIYHLIEKQDWKTLKGIIEEFQECEEQLQKEWSDYE